jgi:hypothetical protein
VELLGFFSNRVLFCHINLLHYFYSVAVENENLKTEYYLREEEKNPRSLVQEAKSLNIPQNLSNG